MCMWERVLRFLCFIFWLGKSASSQQKNIQIHGHTKCYPFGFVSVVKYFFIPKMEHINRKTHSHFHRDHTLAHETYLNWIIHCIALFLCTCRPARSSFVVWLAGVVVSFWLVRRRKTIFFPCLNNKSNWKIRKKMEIETMRFQKEINNFNLPSSFDVIYCINNNNDINPLVSLPGFSNCGLLYIFEYSSVSGNGSRIKWQ